MNEKNKLAIKKDVAALIVRADRLIAISRAIRRGLIGTWLLLLMSIVLKPMAYMTHALFVVLLVGGLALVGIVVRLDQLQWQIFKRMSDAIKARPWAEEVNE